MSVLSEEKKIFYQNLLQVMKQELDEIQQQIEDELATVKERITQLNGEKEMARQVYDGICLRLGVENEFALLESEEEHDEMDELSDSDVVID